MEDENLRRRTILSNLADTAELVGIIIIAMKFDSTSAVNIT